MNTVAPLVDLARPPQRDRIAGAPPTTAPAAMVVLVAHADPVVSAGLAAILMGAKCFRVRVVESVALPRPTKFLVGADVVVADYSSGLRLIDGDPDLSKRMLILTDCDSQGKILHAFQRGVRGYFISGCSCAELLQGVHVVHHGGVALDSHAASRIAETMNQPTLTHREHAILRQMMFGLSNKRIAFQQGIAEGTVKTHVKSILAKLNVATRTQAVIVAQRRGLVEECDNHESDSKAPAR